MVKVVLLLCLASVLMADDAPEKPSARLSLGAFTDSYSDSTGTWKGWSLGGECFRDEHGPWSLSVVGTQRPEGKGTSFTVAKDHSFGESSYVWVSIGIGTGADFVPAYKGVIDLDLGLSGPWSMGLEAGWYQFHDESSTILLQAGPGWLGENWSASARIQQLRYTPEASTDTGYLADVRWGTNNLHRWHSRGAACGAHRIRFGGSGTLLRPTLWKRQGCGEYGGIRRIKCSPWRHVLVGARGDRGTV